MKTLTTASFFRFAFSGIAQDVRIKLKSGKAIEALADANATSGC
jgi:hypothetical protein